jgi:hypothetical protein
MGTRASFDQTILVCNVVSVAIARIYLDRRWRSDIVLSAHYVLDNICVQSSWIATHDIQA